MLLLDYQRKFIIRNVKKMSSSSFIKNYPLAIIGSACYLPDAKSLDEYWSNLSNEKISIRIPDKDRDVQIFWSSEHDTKGHSYSNIAATVNYEEFCRDYVPQLVNIFQNERGMKDFLPRPHGYLTALYTAMEAIRNAGFNPLALNEKRTGFFCGMVGANDSRSYRRPMPGVEILTDLFEDIPSFSKFSKEEQEVISKAFLNYPRINPYCQSDKFTSDTQPHELIRFIQNCLRINGVGFSFDSACSSSLLSLEIARNYLINNKQSMAIVGGVTYFGVAGLVAFSQVSANSAKGSFPFEERSDGLVPGEGCSFSVVKLLDQAIADGDNILGVIRGIGISSDGRAKGLWAPSSFGQTIAIKRALQDSGYKDYNNIDYIEAHATSTRLGDATELDSLTAAIEGKIDPSKKIPITSVKANIGHILEAAGMASLQKVLLSLKNEKILKQPNFQSYSTKYDWKNSHFYVPQENIPWKKSENKIRRAITEAFGIGGLNAHIIIEGPESVAQEKNNPAKNLNNESDNTPIAIIGAGCVLPNAFDVQTFNNLIEKGTCVASPIPDDRDDMSLSKSDKNNVTFPYSEFKGGFVNGYEYDWKLHRIPPKQIHYANPLQFMVLGAVDEAIKSAGYQSVFMKKEGFKILDPDSTAVVAGTKTDSDFYYMFKLIVNLPALEKDLEDVLQKQGVSEKETAALVSDFRDEVYKRYTQFDDETGSYTISTLASRITKTYNLHGGAIALDSGDVASFTSLENSVHLLQNNANIKTSICVAGHRFMSRPELLKYIGKKDFPSEGTVAFVLKRLEDAQKDHDPILAVIRGINGVQLTDTSEKTINSFIDDFTETLPESFDKNEPGTHEFILDDRSPAKDIVCQKLKDLFKNKNDLIYTDFDFEKSKKKSTVRSLLGDLRPVSGAAALLRLITDLNQSKKNEHPFISVLQLDQDGMLYQMVLEREYTGQKEKKVKRIENSTTKETSFEKPRENVNFSTLPERDKIVFMFPGQGSQYKTMFSNLFKDLPELQEVRSSLDSVLHNLQFPDFNDLTTVNASLLGKDVFRTQLSLLYGGTLMAKYFERVGIVPDMVLGHSYGEYPTLTASGVWSFETAAWMTQKRCEIIEKCLRGDASVPGAPSLTTMMSTNAGPDVLPEIINELVKTSAVEENTLYISNRNAPDQIVVSGSRKSIETLATDLIARKFAAIVLNVPAAYHSPLVQNVCQPLKNVLKDVCFSLPKIATLSSVSKIFEAEPDHFRVNLVEQMTKPVNFIDMIKKAYLNGGRYFVEVGPKMVLSRLATKILADCKDVKFFQCDDGRGGDSGKFKDTCEELGKICSAKKSGFKSEIIRINGLCVNFENADKNRSADDQKKKIDIRKNVPAVNSDGTFVSRSLSQNTKICPTVEISGNDHELGFQYGQKLSEDIRRTLRRYADIAGSPHEKLVNSLTDEDIKNAELYFGEEGLEELRGMAEGAGVPYESLLRHNLAVFSLRQKNVFSMLAPNSNMRAGTKISGVNGCVQFCGRTSDGHFVHGSNIDIGFTRIVPDSLSYTLVIRRPEGRIPSVLISPSGLIGCRTGINACGLAVSTCDLLDDEFVDVNIDGLRRGILIQKILDRCRTLDDTIKIVEKSRLCGAKTFCVSNVRTGEILHFEFAGTKWTVCRESYVVQSNHSLLLKENGADTENNAGAPIHSKSRRARLEELLNPQNNMFSIKDNDIFAVLRDTKDMQAEDKKSTSLIRYRSMNMILRLDNAWSWMFHAKTNRLQICLTNSPILEEENKCLWEEFNMKDLLPEFLNFTDEIHKENNDNTSSWANPKSIDLDEKKILNIVKNQDDIDSKILSQDEFVQIVKNEPDTDVNGGITRRFADRLIQVSDLDKAGTLSPSDIILLIGSANNDLRKQLEDKIKKLGGDSVSFDLVNIDGSFKSCEQIQSEIRELFMKGPFYHVILLGSYNSGSPFEYTENCWTIQKNILLGEVFAFQEWYRILIERKELSKMELLVPTRMGGDLGIIAQNASPTDGAYLGLTRGIKFEVTTNRKISVNCYAIDHAFDESLETVVEDILKELVHKNDNKNDIAYYHGNRYISRVIPVKVKKEIIENREKEKPVWLITGGCRGVTAEIAMGIGKKYNARLHLIASTPISGKKEWAALDDAGKKILKKQIVREALDKKEKPAAAWAKVEKSIELQKNLKRFQDAGIEIIYHACDLTNFDKTSELTAQILTTEGKITGLLCGAGFEVSNLIEKKNSNNIKRTIDVKAGSAVAILGALQNNPPQFVTGMGSIAGLFGSNGQLDYSIANNLLGKLLAGFSAGKNTVARECLFQWHAWDEVGMAARPESRIAIQMSGMKFMPVHEGVQFYLNELDGTDKDCEVAATEWTFCKQMYEMFGTKELFKEKPIYRSFSADKKNEIHYHDLKTTSVIFGNNTEARALVKKINSAVIVNENGKICWKNIDQVYLTIACDPDIFKVNSPYRLEQRQSVIQKAGSLVRQWLCERRQISSSEKKIETIVVVKNSAMTNEFQYDEIAILTKEINKIISDLQFEESQKPVIQICVEDLASNRDLNNAVSPQNNNEISPLSSIGILERNTTLNNEGNLSSTLSLNPNTDVFLLNHQLKGQAILPFVVALESFYEFGKQIKPDKILELNNIKAVHGFVFNSNKIHRAEVSTFKDIKKNSIKMRLTGDHYKPDGTFAGDHSLYFTCEPNWVEKQDLPEKEIVFDLKKYPSYMPIFPQKHTTVFYHGPALQQLKECYFINDGELKAEINVPNKNDLFRSEHRKNTSILLDNAVLDAVFWGCGVINAYKSPYTCIVPDCLGKFRVFPNSLQEGEIIHTVVKVSNIIQLPLGFRQVIFDFIVYNSKGEPVYQGNDFRTTELKEEIGR